MMVMHVIATSATPSSTGFNCSFISLYKHTQAPYQSWGNSVRRTDEQYVSEMIKFYDI